MKSKDKNLGGDNRARGIHKPKTVTVAEGSLQSRAPGAVMRGGPDTPFPMTNSGSQQSDLNRGQRSGPGTQGGGWSARQRGERMQAQAEQARLGEVHRSGQGGIEQYQQAGSQQSDSGQGGAQGTPGSRDLPPTDSGSKANKKNPGS